MTEPKNEPQKLRNFIISEIQLANIVNLLQNSNFTNITYSQLNNFLMGLSRLPEWHQEKIEVKKEEVKPNTNENCPEKK